jgi:uncharacterized protein (DUF362 family)
MPRFTRREVLAAAAGLAPEPRPIVSIVKVQNGRIDWAVEHAIELLGGVTAITRGKERIVLKPNLMAPVLSATTKVPVIRSLARVLKAAHKDVSIAEGSAASPNFNIRGGRTFCTSDKHVLNGMQQHVFDELGYSELARQLRVPLINLHTGDLVDVKLSGAFIFDKLTIHRSLVECDLLCSASMMKTHVLAGVTLGMKNLVGAYPGAVYQALRGRMHNAAAKVEPSGTASAIVDMVRANKLGLVVVDGSSAMEGNGPSDGTLVPMKTIIAGTNPLATDMVAAAAMGFEPSGIPTFAWANKAGMRPERIEDIEIRGEPLARVRRNFVKPVIIPWDPAFASAM